MDVVEVVAEKQGEGRGHQKLEDALRETGETGNIGDTWDTKDNQGYRMYLFCIRLYLQQDWRIFFNFFP